MCRPLRRVQPRGTRHCSTPAGQAELRRQRLRSPGARRLITLAPVFVPMFLNSHIVRGRRRPGASRSRSGSRSAAPVCAVLRR